MNKEPPIYSSWAQAQSPIFVGLRIRLLVSPALPRYQAQQKGAKQPTSPSSLHAVGKLGLYWDNGKENGNYYSRIGCLGYIGNIGIKL